MTVGQRIALKRKEMGLSQEGLGERLGVSRQAIYKWESDAALPEIEKLVNLSREFSVSIDWLLGKEDGAPEQPELTPEQLRMVEEIVGRYLDARPAAELSPEEKREASHREALQASFGYMGFMFRILMIGVVAFVVLLLLWRMVEVGERYQSLQNSLNSLSSSVDSQINSIANRVEEVLQSQNSLTAEQSAEVADIDYRANTVTIAARAMPRTYVEGMTAEFILVSDGKIAATPGVLGDDHAFTAELTGALSDNISVSVAFLTGEERETQFINQFFALYSDSFFEAMILFGPGVGKDGRILDKSSCVLTSQAGVAQVTQVRLGLFRDHKLLAWYVPTDEPPAGMTIRGDLTGYYWFFKLEEEWFLEPGYEYCLAAAVTDEYGRERVYSDYSITYDPENGSSWADNVEDASHDPADWEY